MKEEGTGEAKSPAMNANPDRATSPTPSKLNSEKSKRSGEMSERHELETDPELEHVLEMAMIQDEMRESHEGNHGEMQDTKTTTETAAPATDGREAEPSGPSGGTQAAGINAETQTPITQEIMTALTSRNIFLSLTHKGKQIGGCRDEIPLLTIKLPATP